MKPADSTNKDTTKNSAIHFEEAALLDAIDPLRHVRNRFQLPQDIIYLDGNSLGPLPRATASALSDVIQRQWATDLIRSWNNNHWITAPQRTGKKIASLIGAAGNEVIVADSVSVNIFKLLTAITGQYPQRTTILTESGNFPTDAHVAQGVAEMLGLQLKLVPREQITEAINTDTAALLLTHVHYKTGQRFDLATVNAAAKACDVSVLWDLSHSAGAVPLNLNHTGTEFAVGCGYKYLNGGPGAPAFVYVAASQQRSMKSALQGWMGHSAPFSFEDDYQPASGMNRFLIGTPPILSLLALEAALDEFVAVDMDVVWKKSQTMFDFFVSQVTRNCPQLQLMTPTAPNLRGSHVSFSHPAAWPINNALIARGVIGDFRTPDVLRFGLTPLYTRFSDLAHAASILSDIIAADEWKKPEYSRPAVVT